MLPNEWEPFRAKHGIATSAEKLDTIYMSFPLKEGKDASLKQILDAHKVLGELGLEIMFERASKIREVDHMLAETRRLYLADVEEIDVQIRALEEKKRLRRERYVDEAGALETEKGHLIDAGM